MCRQSHSCLLGQSICMNIAAGPNLTADSVRSGTHTCMAAKLGADAASVHPLCPNRHEWHCTDTGAWNTCAYCACKDGPLHGCKHSYYHVNEALVREVRQWTTSVIIIILMFHWGSPSAIPFTSCYTLNMGVTWSKWWSYPLKSNSGCLVLGLKPEHTQSPSIELTLLLLV